MSSTDLQNQWALAYLSGGSMAYVDSLYEDYLSNPDSVSTDWQAAFKNLSKVNGGTQDISHRDIRDYFLNIADMHAATHQYVQDDKSFKVAELVEAFRNFGHYAAKLDPLELVKGPSYPSLDISYHSLSKSDENNSYLASPYLSASPKPLKEIIADLKTTYCGSIGLECMYLTSEAEKQWFFKAMETSRGKLVCDASKKLEILQQLIAADGLERYLGTRFVGQKRFSLEGGDALIPLVKEIINRGGKTKVKEIVIGMAHRGRLNVLVNVLGKEPHQLFQEFEGKVQYERTGDVKYHMGFSSNLRTDSGEIVHLALAFNPSHLEIISPVVEGSVRSRLLRRNDLDKKEKVLPIIIHGDAAFSGQGVVMETFNFSQARGYSTGGTVHIVINNQIGFTTSNPKDARSTFYCTDIAKMVEAPIIHVNGDDPEAVVFAAQIAFDYRARFKRDVVIDLMCYRRHGHNEADEPAVTQPTMYKKIKSMRPLREIYADTLIKEGLTTAETVQTQIDAYRDALDAEKALVDVVNGDYEGNMSVDWSSYIDAAWTDKVATTLTSEKILELSERLLDIPQGFQLHPVVKRLFEEREKMTLGEIPMNWGYAETMAYASLLDEGFGVRLSGQDCGRGTFAHRHAVLHDVETGDTFVPLEKIAKSPQKPFTVIDSVLSEEAVLAFEYGYASSDPESLVLWEAQFGDFANGAQVVIDQFISSGEQKWGRLCGLVMLLPHGYEGQGPEHSSARLERYMQLCAQKNMQVCTPTTPAQIFHLLRRQEKRNFRKPLIIMTPKSLLRHKLAVSPLEDLIKGQFDVVIPEIDEINPDKITRVVLCCGKVYYDLLQKRRDENLTHVAIIRIEQLYPFPKQALMSELAKYPKAGVVIWCQEEPKNQGIWFSSQHNICDCLQDYQVLHYAGRKFAASPAVGSAILHAKQQEALITEALVNQY